MKKVMIFTLATVFFYGVEAKSQNPQGDCEHCIPKTEQGVQCNVDVLRATFIVQKKLAKKELENSNNPKKESIDNLLSSINALRECEESLGRTSLTSCDKGDLESKVALSEDVIRINNVNIYGFSNSKKCTTGIRSAIHSTIKNLKNNITIANKVGDGGWVFSNATAICDAGDYGKSVRSFSIGLRSHKIQFKDSPEELRMPYVVQVKKTKVGKDDYLEIELKKDNSTTIKDFSKAIPMGNQKYKVKANSGSVKFNFSKNITAEVDTNKSGPTVRLFKNGKYISSMPSSLSEKNQNQANLRLVYHHYKNSQIWLKRVNFKDKKTKLKEPKHVGKNIRYEFTNGAYVDVDSSTGKYAGSNFISSDMFDENKCKTNSDSKNYKRSHFTPKVKVVPNKNFTRSVSIIKG